MRIATSMSLVLAVSLGLVHAQDKTGTVKLDVVKYDGLTDALLKNRGKVVYVEQASGEYAARTIHTGLEGELYTQVVDGLAEGDRIVSIGSFFVDADNKLKSAD